jgi:hypothetical protein
MYRVSCRETLADSQHCFPLPRPEFRHCPDHDNRSSSSETFLPQLLSRSHSLSLYEGLIEGLFYLAAIKANNTGTSQRCIRFLTLLSLSSLSTSLWPIVILTLLAFHSLFSMIHTLLFLLIHIFCLAYLYCFSFLCLNFRIST